MPSLNDYFSSVTKTARTTISYYYQQAKTATVELINGPEESLYFQSLAEPQFCQFSSECDGIDRFCLQTWRQLKKRELDLTTLKNQLQAIKSQISSPFYYQQQLAKLAQKIKQHPTLPNQFADIINEARVKQHGYLAKNQITTTNLFYDELFNHLIQLSGCEFSSNRLLKLISFYQDLISPTLLQSITTTIKKLSQQLDGYDQQNDQIVNIRYPNKLFYPALNAINQTFIDFHLQQTEKYSLTLTNPTNTSSQTNSTERLTHITQATISALQTGASFIRQHPKKIIVITAAAIGAYYNQELTTSNNTIGWANNQYHFTTFNQFTTSFTIAYAINSLNNNQVFAAPITFTVGLSTLCQSTFAQTYPDYFFKTLGGLGFDNAYSIQTTADNGYVITGFSDSYTTARGLIIAKLDSAGNLNWAKSLGGNVHDYGRSIQVNSEGNYLLAGETESAGVANGDVLLAKFNETGSLLWAKTFGGDGSDHAYAILAQADNSYVITGDTYSLTDGNGALLAKFDSSDQLSWAKIFYGISNGADQGISITATADLGYLVLGQSASYSAGDPDILTAKFSASGTLEWAQTLGENSIDFGHSIQTTTDQGYVLTGTSYSYGTGNADILLAKFSDLGSLSWARIIGGNNFDEGRSIKETADNGFIIAGFTDSFPTFSAKNALLVKINATGGLSWAKILGGNSSAYSLQNTNNNGFVLAGLTQNLGTGSANIMLAKLDANGDILGCNAFEDVTQSINITTITPTITTVSPTVNDISLTLQNWAINAVDITPAEQTHCTASLVNSSTTTTNTQNPAISSAPSTTNNSTNINPTNLSSTKQGTTNSLATAPSSTTQIKTNSADTPTTTNSQNIPNPNPTDGTLTPISTPSMSLSNNPNTFFTMPTSTLTAPPTTPDNTRQSDNSSSNRSDDSGLSDAIIITIIISGVVVVGICALLAIYIIKPRKEQDKQQPQQLDDLEEKEPTIKSTKEPVKNKSKSGVFANPEESVATSKISATMSPKINSDSDSESNSLSLTSSS